MYNVRFPAPLVWPQIFHYRNLIGQIKTNSLLLMSLSSSIKMSFKYSSQNNFAIKVFKEIFLFFYIIFYKVFYTITLKCSFKLKPLLINKLINYYLIDISYGNRKYDLDINVKIINYSVFFISY